MNIYFMRHAQTYGNKTGNYETTKKGDLSEEGYEQGQLIAEKIQSYEFNEIICSPYTRTMETILPYLKQNNLTAELWPELAEGCYETQQREWKTKKKQNRSMIQLDGELDTYFRFRSDKSGQYLPPREIFSDSLARIKDGYLRIVEEFSEREDINLLIVGHFHSGSRLIELLLQIEPMGRFKHDNVGITKIEYNHQKPMAHYVNQNFINLTSR